MKKLLTLSALALTMLLIVKADVVKNYIVGELPTPKAAATEAPAPQKAGATSRALVTVNLLTNGDASSDWANPNMSPDDEAFGTVCAWSTVNQGDTRPCDIEEVDGRRVFAVHTADMVENPWDNQFFITAPREFNAGEQFRISFLMKASHNAAPGTQAHMQPYNYLHWSCIGNPQFTTEWTEYTREVTVDNSMNGMQSICFLLSDDPTANDYYITDMRWEVNERTGTSPTEIADLIYVGEGIDITVENHPTYPWEIVGNELRPTNIGVHSTYSNFTVNINCPEGAVMSFEWSVESESGCDWVYYNLDDDISDNMHGTVDWTTKSFVLEPGEHNIVIGYRKDGSVNSGRDYGCVRNFIIATRDNYDNQVARLELGEVILSAYAQGHSVVAAYQLYEDEAATTVQLNDARRALEDAMANDVMTPQRRLNQQLLKVQADIERILTETDPEVMATIPDGEAHLMDGLAYCQEVTIEFADATEYLLDMAYDRISRFMDAAMDVVAPTYSVEDNDAVYLVTLGYAIPCVDIKYSLNDQAECTFSQPFIVAETSTIKAHAQYGGARSIEIETEIALDYVEVTVDQPGLFARRMLEKVENFSEIVRLKVNGVLNDTDYGYFQNSLTNLRCVDLSDLNVEEMPGQVFYGTNIQSVKLPKTLKRVSMELFYRCDNLREIEIPEGVTEIQRYAFYYCSNLWSVKLPSTLNVLGYACFSGCHSLTRIDLPESLTFIDNYALDHTGLTSVEIPEAVTNIGAYAFSDCYSLTSVKLPQSKFTLGDGAFHSCSSLPTIELPQGLEYLPRGVFSNCTSMTHIKLNEGITRIGQSAFAYVPLTEIELPSTLVYVEGTFLYNTVRTIVCKAACVPTGNYNIMPSDSKQYANLYVPAVAMTEYKIDPYWSGYAHILPIEGYNPDVINVHKEVYITADTRVDNKPAINVMFVDTEHKGHLVVEGTDTLSVRSFTMQHYDYGRIDNGRWANDINYYTTLINSRYMRADAISTSRSIYGCYWTFLSMPYDVKVSEITPSNDQTQWVVRRYNSANRAAGISPTWETVEYTDTLRAGQGFILMHNGTGFYEYDDDGNEIYRNYRNTTFDFPALNTANKQNIFAAGDITVDLAEYSGEDVYAHNRSWNFIANPYPAFYDIRHTDLTAPITLWRNNNYVAYSPVDDEVILAPNEPFFVQRPVDQAQITFAVSGRQSDNNVRAMAAPQRAADKQVREVFNLTMSQGDDMDQTRFVINEAASLDYEMSRDAAKFTAEDAAMQLYTIGDGVHYAINERPLSDGSILLGLNVAQSGQYTISLGTRSEVEITLIDHELGIQTDLQASDYTFSCEAGTYDGRFEIVVGGTTAISAISAEALAGAQYYTVSGIQLQGAPTAKGIYIMVVNGVSRKISVK